MGESFLRFSPFNKFVPFDAKAAKEAIASLLEHGAVLVATNENEVIGALVGMVSSMWFNPDLRIATELGWWVKDEHRGGSAGIKLLRAFEDFGRRNGASMCALSDLVIDGDAPAGPLFKKLGYVIVERSHLKEIV